MFTQHLESFKLSTSSFPVFVDTGTTEPHQVQLCPTMFIYRAFILHLECVLVNEVKIREKIMSLQCLPLHCEVESELKLSEKVRDISLLGEMLYCF